jgi:hypothetical protein
MMMPAPRYKRLAKKKGLKVVSKNLDAGTLNAKNNAANNA